MAKAKITLTDRGPKTYNWGAISIEQGQSIVATLDDVILHFQSQPGFDVEMLEGSPKTPALLADEEEAEESDGEEAGGELADGLLTEKELKKQNKTALLQLAEERGLKVDPASKNADIVKALLEDQAAELEG